LEFDPGLYFKNEFQILVDSYINCTDENNVKISVTLNGAALSPVNLAKDMYNDEHNLQEIEWIDITADDLYNAIKDKNLVLSKFKSELKFVTRSKKYNVKKITTCGNGTQFSSSSV
jgi:hypothetical protein